MDNKNQWPECTGMLAEEAKQLINSQDAQIKVQLIEEGSMMTMDFREDRVRVFFNGENKVVGVPHRG